MLKYKKIFKHSKRWAALLGIGTLSFGLLGCGDNGASNNAQNDKSDKVTQFILDNSTRYDIKSARLVNNAGIPTGQFELACVSGSSSCQFNTSVSAPGRLLFLDKRGKLIGVASVAASDKEERAFVEPSKYVLGSYIYSELTKRYAEPDASVQPKLTRFFKNYQTAKLHDNNLRLASYYLYRVVDKSADANIDEFIKNLHERLERGDELESGLDLALIKEVVTKFLAGLSDIQFISSAHAEAVDPAKPTQTCGPEVTYQLAFASGVADFIPGVGIFTEIAKTACDNADSAKTEEALKKIQAQLNELQKTVKSTDGKMDALQKTLSGSIASTYIQGLMDARRIYLDTYLNKYYVLTAGHGTLSAYVKSQGGLKKAFNIDKTGNSNLDYVLKMSNAWTGLDYVNGNTDGKWGTFSSFIDALHDSCNTPPDNVESATNDIVKNRVECNAKIAYFKTYVVAMNAEFLQIYKDVTDTLEGYMATEGDVIRAHADGPTKNQPTSWKQMYTDTIQPTLRDSIAVAAAGKQFAPYGQDLPGGYYKFEAGLPEPLGANIKRNSLNCNSGAWSSDPRPNLVGWVKNGENSFITIRCWNNDTEPKTRKLYTSRYYYEKDGHDVMNILGVLATADRSKNRSAAEYKFEYADGKSVKKLYIDIPQSFGIYVGDAFPSVSLTAVNPEKVPGGRITRTSSSEAPTKGYESYETYETQYLSNGRNTSVTFVRYTEPTGTRKESDSLSYVWAVAFWSNGSTIYAGLSSAMICLTWNCGRNNDELSFYSEGGQYGFDGPKDVWHGARPRSQNNLNYRINGTVYKSRP